MHQAQPAGAADLDDPVHGPGRPALLVQRCPGGEGVAGVEADPGLGVVVERCQVRRQVLDAGAQRAALARGRLEHQPRQRVVVDASRAAATTPRGPPEGRLVQPFGAGRVDVRAGVHDHPLRADLHRAPEVVRDRRHRPFVGRAASATRGSRGTARGSTTRIPLSAQPSRNAASSAGLPALSAQPRGLPVKTCTASSPSSPAPVSVALDQPRPDLDVGADRVPQGGAYPVTSRGRRSDRPVRALGQLGAGAGVRGEDEAEAEVARGLLDVDDEARAPRGSRWRRRRRRRRTSGTSTSSGPERDEQRDRVALEERAARRAPGR